MEKAILKGKKSIESHEPENGKEGSLGSKKRGVGLSHLAQNQSKLNVSKKNFVTGTITNEDIEDNLTRVPSCQSHFLNNKNMSRRLPSCLTEKHQLEVQDLCNVERRPWPIIKQSGGNKCTFYPRTLV